MSFLDLVQTESKVVLDTSAIVAMITEEPESDEIFRISKKYLERLIGSPSVLEAGMILLGQRNIPLDRLSRFLEIIDVKTVPFDAVHADVAIQAFERYGRGRHPAALNFGDCMTYAVAKVAGAPLLFVGNDFGQTDVKLPDKSID